MIKEGEVEYKAHGFRRMSAEQGGVQKANGSCLVDTNMDAEITTGDENILITSMRPSMQGAYTCVDKFYVFLLCLSAPICTAVLRD